MTYTEQTAFCTVPIRRYNSRIELANVKKLGHVSAAQVRRRPADTSLCLCELGNWFNKSVNGREKPELRPWRRVVDTCT